MGLALTFRFGISDHMDAYRRALSAYLQDRTQEALAVEIGHGQPVINRYVTGERFPTADIARKIHAATEGAVPFDLWQTVALEKLISRGSQAESAAA